MEKVTTFLLRTKLGLGLLSFRFAGLLRLAVSVVVRVRVAMRIFQKNLGGPKSSA